MILSWNTRIGFIGIDLYRWGLSLWIDAGRDKKKPPFARSKPPSTTEGAER